MVASTAFAADLKGPVDVAARHALVGRPLGPLACAAPPAPVRDIAAEPFYSDRAFSVVDPARYAAREKIVKPIEDYLRGVVRMTDRWVEAVPPRPETAACALDWLDAWARADAMLGQVTPQGTYERKWTLGGLALAYLNIRDAPGLDAAAKARVEAWFARLATEVRRYYDRPAGPGITDKLNNHRYWAALAVAAAAVATGDRSGLDWAIASYRVGIGQIDADGTLPLELARAGKALHYHVFSVAPLVMVAEIAAANGIDLYGEPGGALGRLVARVVEGLSEPGRVRAPNRDQAGLRRFAVGLAHRMGGNLVRAPPRRGAGAAPARPSAGPQQLAGRQSDARLRGAGSAGTLTNVVEMFGVCFAGSRLSPHEESRSRHHGRR